MNAIYKWYIRFINQKLVPARQNTFSRTVFNDEAIVWWAFNTACAFQVL